MKHTRKITAWLLMGFLTASLALFNPAAVYASGGGGGDGGGEGGTDGSTEGSAGKAVFVGLPQEDVYKIFGTPPGGRATAGARPVPPAMTREEIIKLKKAFPGFTTVKERELQTQQFFNERNRDTANTEAALENAKYNIARTTGIGATVAAGVVAVVASGGTAAPAVAKVSIIGDALAAGAGSVSQDWVDGKSATEAVKNAVGPMVQKGVVSTLTSRINIGHTVVNNTLGTTVNLAHDEIGFAPNTAPAPPTTYAPFGGGYSTDVTGKNM